MKTLEEIRNECRNENHAARITNENTNDEQRAFYEFPDYQTAAAELLA